MTENTTNSSRRERRRQAQPLLARAVANNAGSFGRGVAIAAAASGMLASSAVAANAVPQDDQDAPAQRTESGAIPGQELTDYLPGTRGAIEQLAAQKGVGESLLFQQLVSDQDFVADNGELDHGAIADQVESQDEGAEENSGSDQTLDDYLPGTRGVVEELAELEGESPEAEFEALISNDAYVADNGELDHQALVSRVAELSGQNESAEQESEQEQASAQPEQAPAEEDSSQQSSASLDAYLPGTRGLVEELAQQEGVSATAMFDQLIGDSASSSGGVLDHAALQARVDELTGADEQQAQQTQQAEQQAQQTQQAEQTETVAASTPQEAEEAEEQEEPQSSGAGSLGAVVSAAYSGLGTPYAYGGKDSSGWDCSGFVSWAYAQAGYSIPSSTSAIQGAGNLRWTDNPQPGDLVIQNGGGHVAIYVGNGQFIGAQNADTGTLQYSYESRPGNSHVGYMTLR